METMEDLQTDLYYHLKGDPEHALVPQKIMNFLRLAQNRELEQIPQGLREFFQLNKNSYTKLCGMEKNAQVEGLKKIVTQYADLQKEKSSSKN